MNSQQWSFCYSKVYWLNSLKIEVSLKAMASTIAVYFWSSPSRNRNGKLKDYRRELYVKAVNGRTSYCDQRNFWMK